MIGRRKVYHLVLDKEEKVWKGRQEGGKRSVVVEENKVDALAELIGIARNQPLAQIKIHKTNGTIQEERTYGKDPKKYPG
jgi:hypothetical protein